MCVRGSTSVSMMLRVFLLASLLVVTFADQHKDDHNDHDDHLDDHLDELLGCCSMEDRRDVQQMWNSVWSSSFTEGKVAICKEMFGESVSQPYFYHHNHHHHPVHYRILCKVATLMHDVFHYRCPAYLQNLVTLFC